ncbi:uncharacterized protein LOC130451622 [Diorhabda sublineata]|uniref:uncharacterized protein LOC130451622 n=1 Tax=Diorhabda sublineata TaxID=1163346 RepID=UPI0024E08D84|nr:uncharacterized protein LOC130451622 [Diorhabda sublineata]XP_056646742.1 uncharacterized protein LOC130451622 [Diorhabda sublineata]
MKTNRDDGNIFKIDANTSDIILTPFSCASIINEIIKGLLYQKCQIPYSYSRMKIMVTKKRQKTSETPIDAGLKLRAECHFLVVSKVLDTVESAMTSITDEFIYHKNKVKSVVFVLGTTPFTVREVITINVSCLLGHIEDNHAAELNKYQQKILRSIFLRQEWLDKIEANIPSTNVHIYIKKMNDCSPLKSSGFEPSVAPSFSNNTKQVQIFLKSDMRNDRNCCESFKVFEDLGESMGEECEDSSKDEIENLTWYKYKDSVKGFKDCFVNKKPLNELW